MYTNFQEQAVRLNKTVDWMYKNYKEKQVSSVFETTGGTVFVGSNSAGKVAYGTEGGFYENAGIPTIICGPGDIAQAHQPDEWIAESELDACDKFIRRLADRLLV